MTAAAPPPRSRTRDREVRDEQIVPLLLAGYAVAAITRQLGCSRATVGAVRSRPEVQKRLAEERAKRADAHEAMLEDARRILREGGVDAAHALVDAVTHHDPNVRARAAAQILDRIGIPRIEEVRQRGLDRPDLSKLTDDELREWERLNAKVTPT